MDTPPAAAAAAEIDERDIAMLHELAEIGLRLARHVAEFTEHRIAEARQSGWDGNVPRDPSAAFSRLAQSVRRSLALKAHLRENGAIGRRPAGGGDGGHAGGKPDDGLFASSGQPIGLDPDFAETSTPEPADHLVREARADEERRETIAGDLGPLLDPRERLFGAAFRPISGHAAEIMASLGIDPARVARTTGPLRVAPDPADPHNPGEVALGQWRPCATPILRAAGWRDVPDLPPIDLPAIDVPAIEPPSRLARAPPGA